MINGVILVVLVLITLKVSADVREDIGLVEKFQEVQTQEELDELQTVCDESSIILLQRNE